MTLVLDRRNRNGPSDQSRYAQRPKVGVSRPPIRGCGVTVCIASIAESGRSIVVATDQMVSMTTVSADHTVVKGDFMGVSWFAMWAGDDITVIPAIIKIARDKLEGEDSKSFNWTATQVAAALSSAYQQETRTRAEGEYLSPFGLDLDGFLSRGSRIFESEYAARLQAIEHFDLGITFLVAGYTALTPSIFTVGRRGLVRYFNKPGFWVIGSGETLALGALALRRHNTLRTTQETLYSVLEAKFAAELAPGVGQHTTVGVMTHGDLMRLMPNDRIETIRRVWEEQGKPPMPPDALRHIHEWWHPIDEAQERSRRDQAEAMFRQLGSKARSIPPRSKRGRKGPPPSRG